MADNRTLARIAVATLLALGVAACSTAVSGHGELALGSGPVRGGPSGAASAGSPAASPTVRLDTTAERRITCLLILPSVSKVITDWNSYVDHRGGTRESVAASLSSNAALLGTMLRGSRLPATDPVRSGGTKLSADMALMAQSLRRGGTPPVGRFNADKRRLQASCPA
jgi:hypothetical protein